MQPQLSLVATVSLAAVQITCKTVTMAKWGLVLLHLLFPCCLFAQTINTIAGNGGTTYSGNGISATAAGLPNPIGGAFDNYGNYYFADGLSSHRIRKINVESIITTVAGNGLGGFSSDGISATASELNWPHGVDVDISGNLYILDKDNNRIRKVDATTGVISTIVGTGPGTYGGDNGPATAAQIYNAQNICLDKHGNLYIADFWNNRVRKVNQLGVITTIAGGGAISSVGYTGPATAMELINPNCVAVDDTGAVYIGESTSSTSSNRIRRVDTFGIITTIAGNGGYIYTGDGTPATNASFAPNSIAFNSMGELFIADRVNRRIYKIDHSGILHHVAGNGMTGFIGDGGPATSASIDYPSGLAFDVCDNLYIPDVNNRRIRKVTFNPPTTPTVTITSISTAPIGTTVTVNAIITGAGSAYTIKWFKNATLFSTTTSPVTTYIKGPGTDAITARVVPAITYCYDSAMSSALSISETVGVIDAYSPSVSIYPNPAYTELVINAADPIRKVVVTNLFGQAVEVSNEFQGEKAVVQVGHLPTGMYLLKVNDTWLHRFYKE